MTHRAEAFMHRYQRGKELVYRGIGDVLGGSSEDILSVIYFLKETGGVGKLAAIARNLENSVETRNIVREALRIISDDSRFEQAQREFAGTVVHELAFGRPRLDSYPMTEGIVQ